MMFVGVGVFGVLVRDVGFPGKVYLQLMTCERINYRKEIV